MLPCRLHVLLLLVTQVLAIRWMALLQTTSVASIDQADQCDGLPGLTRRQIRICKRNLEVMESVRSGAKLALRECQWQFRARRWNCSNNGTAGVFGKEVTDGTREAAFLHAVSAAGVAHSVTRACSGGTLGRCGCDRTVRGFSSDGFQWSGCSDNVHYGSAFAKSFVDARDLRDARGGTKKKSAKSSARALMNLHNNEVGRKVVEYNMRIDCKCHGVSGSCETKTCWRALPRFRLVGALLRERFDKAAEVHPTGSRRLVPIGSGPQSDTDLVYLQSSPDFCEMPGTHGRPCNVTSLPTEPSEEGCDILCCGRGYESKREKVLQRCECKFYWCCFVKCRECEIEVEKNYCL